MTPNQAAEIDVLRQQLNDSQKQVPLLRDTLQRLHDAPKGMTK